MKNIHLLNRAIRKIDIYLLENQVEDSWRECLVLCLELLKNERAIIEQASSSETAEDVVNHPAHYNAGKIETFDYITDNLSDNEFRGYIKGNILKYISRERHKNGIEDLKKAQWYLNRLIAKLEAEK